MYTCTHVCTFTQSKSSNAAALNNSHAPTVRTQRGMDDRKILGRTLKRLHRCRHAHLARRDHAGIEASQILLLFFSLSVLVFSAFSMTKKAEMSRQSPFPHRMPYHPVSFAKVEGQMLGRSHEGIHILYASMRRSMLPRCM